tara:strand:- start:1099 stop:1641 length:543 start_codon:yes stop_codon:yes gene_type:complete
MEHTYTVKCLHNKFIGGSITSYVDNDDNSEKYYTYLNAAKFKDDNNLYLILFKYDPKTWSSDYPATKIWLGNKWNSLKDIQSKEKLVDRNIDFITINLTDIKMSITLDKQEHIIQVFHKDWYPDKWMGNEAEKSRFAFSPTRIVMPKQIRVNGTEYMSMKETEAVIQCANTLLWCPKLKL